MRTAYTHSYTFPLADGKHTPTHRPRDSCTYKCNLKSNGVYNRVMAHAPIRQAINCRTECNMQSDFRPLRQTCRMTNSVFFSSSSLFQSLFLHTFMRKYNCVHLAECVLREHSYITDTVSFSRVYVCTIDVSVVRSRSLL